MKQTTASFVLLLQIRKVRKVCIFLPVLISLILGLGFGKPDQAIAQTTGNTWENPVNLSHSGSSTDPVMAIDDKGNIYVIWQDAYSGMMYSNFNGSEWSQPVTVSLPFARFKPKIIADNGGLIHAFWIGDQGSLYYSQVQSNNFASSKSWQTPKSLGRSIVAMTAIPGDNNALHLAFVQNQDLGNAPAGVYYRRSIDGGNTWYLPVQLYQSPYMRGLNKDVASVEMATAKFNDTARLFVTWQNQPRMQLFLARSINNGIDWDQPVVVDDPESNQAASIFQNIKVAAEGDNALIIWEAGDSNNSCSLYYQ